jgi:hypothetical protein
MTAKQHAIPPLSVSCLAEYITRGNRSPESILRPYKFKDLGEGRARIVFHPPVLTVIRRFYKSNRDAKVISAAIADWESKADKTDKKSVRSKLHSNIKGLRLFLSRYENREFESLPGRKISCLIEQLVFNASPDLWVRANGRELLIKVGFGKKGRSYVDVVLAVMRRAALMHGYRVRQREALYLNLRTGEEMFPRFSYKQIAVTLSTAARQIERIWPRVTASTAPTPSLSKSREAMVTYRS